VYCLHLRTACRPRLLGSRVHALFVRFVENSVYSLLIRPIPFGIKEVKLKLVGRGRDNLPQKDILNI
jgi:hypothetical protein